MDRTQTGIEGLDKALNGGIPYKNIVLVSGGAGTGKSTLCMQILVNGAKKFGEKGLYISTEQTREELIKSANNYGWNLEELEKKGLLKIVFFDVIGPDGFIQKIYDLYINFKPQRVALDSLTTFTDSLLVSDVKEDTAFSMVQIAESVSPIPRTEKIIAKTLLYNLMKKLRTFTSTILMTTEIPENSDFLSADQVSEFICDGVIKLEDTGVAGDRSINLSVKKMRYTKIDRGFRAVEFRENGLFVETEISEVLLK